MKEHKEMINEKIDDEVLSRVRLVRNNMSQSAIVHLSEADKKATKDILKRDGILKQSSLDKAREDRAKINRYQPHTLNKESRVYYHDEADKIFDLYEQHIKEIEIREDD